MVNVLKHVISSLDELFGADCSVTPIPCDLENRVYYESYDTEQAARDTGIQAGISRIRFPFSVDFQLT
jgi:hypothetical protein